MRRTMIRKNRFDTRANAVALLHSASPQQQERIIRHMTPDDMLQLDTDFEMWAHHGQREPPGAGWRTWMMMAGRGFGKTRAGAEWVHRLATGRPGVRIALIGASIDESRRIMIEGVSG